MKLLRSLSVYTFVGFFGAGINFLLMPVLSHHMSPADYGISSLFNTYVTLLFPLVGLVAYTIINVEYFHIEDKKEFASLFSSIAFIPVLPTLLLFFAGWASYRHLAGPMELPPDAGWWALGMVPLAAMSVYIDTAASYQVVAKDSKTYARYNLSKTIIEVGLTIFFVVAMKMGWKGRILSWMLTSVLFTGIAFFYFQKKNLLTTNVQWRYIRQGLLFGMPLILHMMGKFVVNQSDRLFISKMVSLDEAGIYSVGYTVGMVMLIVATAMANISGPYIMERLKDVTPEKKRQIRQLTYACIGGLAGMLLFLNIMSPAFFRYFMDARYSGGAQYVFWISLGYLFWGAFLLFSSYIYYYKKNNYLVMLAVVNILTNIAFNYLFIKQFGGIGAAYATALSFLINLLLLMAKLHKMLPWLRFRVSDFRR